MLLLITYVLNLTEEMQVKILIFVGNLETVRLGGKGDSLRRGSGDLLSRNHNYKSETDDSGHGSYTGGHPSMHFKKKNQRFSFSNVLIMTNNFERTLGEGGGGTVYYGTLEDQREVAVKVLKPSSSSEDYKQFHTEVFFIFTFHVHKSRKQLFLL